MESPEDIIVRLAFRVTFFSIKTQVKLVIALVYAANFTKLMGSV